MLNALIVVRKKLLLPIKWKIKRNKEIKNMKTRDNAEVHKKIEEVTTELTLAQRLNQKNKISAAEGKLEILNWLVYVSTKVEGSG